jgi:hypothetical protein
MARKSFLQRVDGSGNTINGGSRSRGSGPTGMQMYKDFNNLLGGIFRMIGSFFGVNIDKYMKKGGRKSVNVSAGRRVRKGKKAGLMKTITKGFR